MKKKYISEVVQTFVDVVYFKVYNHSSESLRSYITSGDFKVETSIKNKVDELLIYDSLIYPDFLPDKYFINYTDKEHDALEEYLSSVKDLSNMKVIKVFNVYRITHTLRYHLAHYLFTYFDSATDQADEKSLGLFAWKMDFILTHVDSPIKEEYYQMWQQVIDHLQSECSMLDDEKQPIGQCISNEIIAQLKVSFSI